MVTINFFDFCHFCIVMALILISQHNMSQESYDMKTYLNICISIDGTAIVLLPPWFFLSLLFPNQSTILKSKSLEFSVTLI